MNKDKEIRKYLNVIKRAVSLIESMLEEDGGLLEQMIQPVQQNQIVQPIKPVVEQTFQVVESPRKSLSNQEPVIDQEWVKLRKKHISDLLAIADWPEAVPEELAKIIPSEKDHICRANSVLDFMLNRSIEGLRFLDFGCGEGWLARQAVSRGVGESVGYDPFLSDKWINQGVLKYISDPNLLPDSHFDVVMLYDVLDHVIDPEDVMKKVKKTIKKDGMVYVRCHPWTSKHASHLFKKGLNKAWIHLFLKNHEIKELIGSDPMFTRPEKDCLTAYKWWFRDFKILNETPTSEKVPDFFHNPDFKNLLANEQEIPSKDVDQFLNLMQNQFVDYLLTPR